MCLFSRDVEPGFYLKRLPDSLLSHLDRLVKVDYGIKVERCQKGSFRCLLGGHIPLIYALDYIVDIFGADVELEFNYLWLYAVILQFNYRLPLSLSHIL